MVNHKYSDSILTFDIIIKMDFSKPYNLRYRLNPKLIPLNFHLVSKCLNHFDEVHLKIQPWDSNKTVVGWLFD